VSGFGLYVTLLFVAIGALAPYLAVYRKGSKRLSAFDAQLPSALNTLAGSLKAGHSFTQALQVLVEEAGPPMDVELRRVMTETRLGRSMDTSLMEMGRRVGSKELNLVLRAVIVQRQVGGSMAGLFELVADTLVQRQQFHQKVKALTAQGRMTAVLLIALPFMIGFLLSLVSPGYLNPLFHSGTGQVLTTTAILMMTFGALMLRKITSFRGYR
jgi:tight adherence protein B